MIELPAARVCIVFQESEWGWLGHWDLITCFTLALALVTLWLAIETRQLRKDAARSAEAARASIILSHRPKLTVRNVMIEGDPFASNLDISGTFQIYNAGNTVARVFNVTWKSWVGEHLPMQTPYDTRGGDKRDNPLFSVRPGVYQTEPFSINDKFNWGPGHVRNPTNYKGLKNGSFHIYIMGDISYSDDLNNQRVTRFCRRYDADRKRFFAVDDPEYESVD